MDYQSVYTSTGCKFIHHPELVKKLKKGFANPISLSISPTSRCNLQCTFCSNVNRDSHEDLDVEKCLEFIKTLKSIGLKAVTITGGGDPTMYHGINVLIQYCNMIGLKIGLITNGILLKGKVAQSCLDMLTWVRISMNGIDYNKRIDLPDIKGTLGFSYVINDQTTDAKFETLDGYVKEYRPEYVRIVPNCQVTIEQQEKNNREYSKLVEKLGKPYFYQAKVFEKPDHCYFGYTNPFLLHDGWIYPCSSVVLNDDADRQFHEKYRMVHMNMLPDFYKMPMKSFCNDSCSHCVFTAQNNILADLVHNDSPHNDFV